MKRLRFCFDVVSPHAHLAFERLPQVLEGLSVEVRYQPVLFAGCSSTGANKGPAEIAPKKAWTFRQVGWPRGTTASRSTCRLSIRSTTRAAAPGAFAARRCRRHAEPAHLRELLFQHVWTGGHDANDPVWQDASAREAAAPARSGRRRREGRTPRRDRRCRGARDLRRADGRGRRQGVLGPRRPRCSPPHLRGDAWFDGPAWTPPRRCRQAMQRRP